MNGSSERLSDEPTIPQLLAAEVALKCVPLYLRIFLDCELHQNSSIFFFRARMWDRWLRWAGVGIFFFPGGVWL